MDTRTEIASRVLAGLVTATSENGTWQEIATDAVAYADALIAALGGAEQMPEGVERTLVRYTHSSGLTIEVERVGQKWLWCVNDMEGAATTEREALQQAIAAAERAGR